MHVFAGMDDSPCIYGNSLIMDAEDGSWYNLRSDSGERFAHASFESVSGELWAFGGVSTARCYDDLMRLSIHDDNSE